MNAYLDLVSDFIVSFIYSRYSLQKYVNGNLNFHIFKVIDKYLDADGFCNIIQKQINIYR